MVVRGPFTRGGREEGTRCGRDRKGRHSYIRDGLKLHWKFLKLCLNLDHKRMWKKIKRRFSLSDFYLFISAFLVPYFSIKFIKILSHCLRHILVMFLFCIYQHCHIIYMILIIIHTFDFCMYIVSTYRLHLRSKHCVFISSDPHDFKHLREYVSAFNKCLWKEWLSLVVQW